MVVELEADLNADPTNEFGIKGEKNLKRTGHEWMCKCCGRNFTGPGHKCKLTVHTGIAGKKILNKREMGCVVMHC